MQPIPQRLARRGSAGIIVQASSSASNFVLSAAILRSTQAAEFAVFLVHYAVLQLVVELARSSFTELRLAGRRSGAHSRWSEPWSSAIAVAAIAVPWGLWISVAEAGSVAALLLAFAPLIAAEDSLRMLSLGTGRATSAVLANLCWLALQAGLTVFTDLSPGLAWGVGSAGAVLTYLIFEPRARLGMSRWPGVRPTSAVFGLEVAVGRAAAAAAMVLAEAQGATTALASYGASRLLLTPAVVALSAAPSIVLPLLAQGGRARNASLTWAIPLGLGLLPMTAAVAAASAPASFVRLAIGTQDQLAGRSAVLIAGVGLGIGGLRLGLRLWARVLGCDRLVLTARAVNGLGILLLMIGMDDSTTVVAYGTRIALAGFGACAVLALPLVRLTGVDQ